MTLFEWWSIPRKGWIIILAELSVIIGFSGWVVAEYFNDIYFQAYLNSLMPVLVPVLSVAFGVASASTATVLYFGTRNLRRLEDNNGSSDDWRKRGQTRKAAKKSLQTDSRVVRSAPMHPDLNSKARPVAPMRGITQRETSPVLPSEKKESK